MSNVTNTVYLIGAGPGNPGLLTLRGAELLGRCDVVLYDGLSNADLLRHAPGAQHISVGKHGQSRIWKQHEIIDEMLRHARQGKSVARLKGGDPAVFARTAEEVDALREADIPFEIVPGITAALAAGSFAGIPITHRKLASAVALITGHEEPGKTESALDWDALAKFPGTLVIYMGVTTAETWTRSLIDAGKDPDTPVAIVRRCSLPDQQAIHCKLSEVADRLTPANKFRPPVITIIGPVSQLAESMDWVRRRPLHGQTVLVTRPKEKSQQLADPLRELGAQVLIQPAIETTSLADPSHLIATISELTTYDWVIFCSQNAVEHFMRQWQQTSQTDIRSFASVRLACVGEKTADVLWSSYRLRADIVPSRFDADSLSDELTDQVDGKRVLIVRANRGRDVLPERLNQAGAITDQVAAYQNTDIDTIDPAIKAKVDQGDVDWITITSSATAQRLAELLGSSLHKSKIASLSPVTSQTIRQLGYQVAAEANPYTIDSLVESILDHDS